MEIELLNGTRLRVQYPTVEILFLPKELEQCRDTIDHWLKGLAGSVTHMNGHKQDALAHLIMREGKGRTT